MDFENKLVGIEEVPKLEQASFKGLEQDYLWLRLSFIGIFFLIASGISIIPSISPDIDWWNFLLPLTILVVLRVLVEVLGFKIKGYAIRENDISYKTGLLFFSMVSIPFNRVQHTEVTQSPLARMFDLATVKVFTAGGSNSDLSIAGLKKEDAHKLKDHITQLSSQHV